MSKIKLVLLSALAVFAVAGVASATASAHEFKIEKKGIVADESISGSSKTSVLESKISGKAFKLKCTSDTFTGTIKAGGKDTGTVTFKGCTVDEPAEGCLVEGGEIKAKVNSELIGAAKPVKELFTPEVGETFATFTLTTCALKGKYEVKGSQECDLPEGETEKVEHSIDCKKAGSKLKLGKEAASYESLEEKVVTKSKLNWSAI